ncbi:MAG: hypothetical protein H3C47_16310 [Candidatus Cloacimonetes bacterium]|nr:hypothetical protein [Candidatus Cloacimonadota bacterium]
MLWQKAVLLVLVSSLYADPFSDLVSVGGTGTASADIRRNVIPPKENDELIRFAVQSDQVQSWIPRATALSSFSPVRDMPRFVNFPSLSVVGDQLVAQRDVNAGTCFGFSYFVHMWYNRLTGKVLSGNNPILYKNKKREVHRVDLMLGNDTELTGTSYDDGVSYVVMEDLKHHQAQGTHSRFLPQSIRAKPENLGLQLVSESDLREKVMLGMIAHQEDQRSFAKIDIVRQAPGETDEKMYKLRDRLQEHGSIVMYFFRYKASDSWNQWGKVAWGHAVLLYRISLVMVSSGNGSQRRAWKMHLADPNMQYTDPEKLESGEGFGSYLLYFPDSRQLTFSQKMQAMYVTKVTSETGEEVNEPLLTQNSIADGREVKVGYYEAWEGHPSQELVAYNRFLDARVGRGSVITLEELRKMSEATSPGQNSEQIVMNPEAEEFEEID